MQVPIPFVGPTYTLENKALGIQDTINYYIQVDGTEARTPLSLLGSPGLIAFTTGLNGPVDSMYFFDGVLYATAGGSLYTITSDGTATNRGGVGKNDRHMMSFNGTQVTIVDGAVGYVYTVATSVLTQILDTDYEPATHVVFQDTYSIFNEAGTDLFFISSTSDSTSFDGTEFAKAQTAPDNILAVLSDHRQLVILCATVIEFWYDSGNIDFPYERQEGAIIERGLGAKYALAKDDGSFFWLGDDLKVYKANGYAGVPISTAAIDETIQGYSTTSDAFMDTYTWNGHKFLVLTFPTEKATWECDVGLPPQLAWHKRESFDKERWRANCLVKNGNNQGGLAYGKNLVGDFETGTIWYMDKDTYKEGSDILKATRIANYIHADQKNIWMSELEILMASGVGLISGQGSEPQIMLQTSKNGTGVFGNERRMKLGKKGKFRRVYSRNFGKFKSKAFELTITDPVNRDILGAYGEITIGH